MNKYALLEEAKRIKDMGYLTSAEFLEEKDIILSLSSNGIKKRLRSYKNIETIGKLKENGTFSDEEFQKEKSNLIIPGKKFLSFKDFLIDTLNSYLNYIFFFKGRIGRIGYMIYMLIIVTTFLSSIGLMDFENTDNLGFICLLFLSILMFYLFISINIKRLHDMGKSGLWILFFWTQIYFFIILLVSGTNGVNKYGKLYSIKQHIKS